MSILHFMDSPSVKKMIYITIQDRERNPYLEFESEGYFKNSHRRGVAKQDIWRVTKDNYLEDKEFLSNLSFKILLGLLSERIYKPLPEYKWTQCVYFHDFEGKPAILIDEETYEYKPHREYCAKLTLPSLDAEIVLRDERFGVSFCEVLLDCMQDQWPSTQER